MRDEPALLVQARFPRFHTTLRRVTFASHEHPPGETEQTRRMMSLLLVRAKRAITFNHFCITPHRVTITCNLPRETKTSNTSDEPDLFVQAQRPMLDWFHSSPLVHAKPHSQVPTCHALAESKRAKR